MGKAHYKWEQPGLLILVPARLQGMSPGAPASQAAKAGAILGAYFQVGQKQLPEALEPEAVGLQGVKRGCQAGGTGMCAPPGCYPWECTAEPFLGAQCHSSQDLAQNMWKGGAGFSSKPSGTVKLGKKKPRSGKHRAEVQTFRQQH